MSLKIAIFGVRYSPNLGDGIISDCLKYLTQSHFTTQEVEVEVEGFDLAGRVSFANNKVEKRAKMIAFLAKLPRTLSQLLVGIYLLINYLRRLKPFYNQIVAKSDIIIIGGGQILSDTDLNFPIKIWGLAQSAHRYSRPISFSSCGATANWSSIGGYLLRNSLGSVITKYIGCRDERSYRVISTYLHEKEDRKIHLQADPALFVEETYAIQRQTNSKIQIGIGFASFDNLKYSGSGSAMNQTEWFDLIFDLMKCLSATDKDIFLFTNGAAEDEKCLDEFEAYLLVKSSKTPLPYTRIERPDNPHMLVKTIAQADCILAYRLHASITSFGLSIPSIGFYWDDKVLSFYQKIERERFCIQSNATNINGEELYRLVLESLELGTNPELLKDMKEQLKQSVHQMFTSTLQNNLNHSVTNEITSPNNVDLQKISP